MEHMATKHDKELAYEAGRAVMSEPTERRTVSACPFAEGEERTAWLEGFESALNEQEDLSEVRRALKEAKDNA